MIRKLRLLSDKLLGISLVIISAISCSIGAFFWKIADASFNIELVAGYFFQILALPLFILAFKFGKLSILHPLMSFSYVVTVILGVVILDEKTSFYQILGLSLIILGIIVLCKEKNQND